MTPDFRRILSRLKARKNLRNIKGMARFGIAGKNVLGIPKPVLDKMARGIGMDHGLAIRLWNSGIHEARILAAQIEDPAQVTGTQMEKWVLEFDSWDVCDQCCGRLFDRTRLAERKIFEWTRREEEFVKRAGFVLMASLAVHDKKKADRTFEGFFPVIRREAWDGRNFVKKAVNWALRQIGKRNKRLNGLALREARVIQRQGTPSARWIAADAIRELSQRRFPAKKPTD